MGRITNRVFGRTKTRGRASGSGAPAASLHPSDSGSALSAPSPSRHDHSAHMHLGYSRRAHLERSRVLFVASLARPPLLGEEPTRVSHELSCICKGFDPPVPCDVVGEDECSVMRELQARQW